jgi:isoleucyl-tRNA synthetase
MLPWPSVDERVIDAGLEQGMIVVRGFVEASAAVRQQAKLKLRWPVSKAVVQTSRELRTHLKPLEQLLGAQLNCKELVLIGPDEDFDKRISESFALMQTEFGKIAIDTKITPELQAECLARELVRRLQTMRKEMDLGMEERVDADVGVKTDENLRLLATQQKYISREVRVKNLRILRAKEIAGEGYIKDWSIDGDSFKLLIKRLSA